VDMEHVAMSELLAYFTKADRLLHAKVTGHLLEGCSACFAEAKHVLATLSAPFEAENVRDLSTILSEAALLKDELSKAAVSWAGIAEMDELRRFSAISTRRGLKKYGLAAYVLDEAETFVSRGRCAKAAELLKFSSAVVACLPARIYGRAPLTDLQLRQEVVLCQVKRLELEFVEALAAIGRAERIRDSGVALKERARFYRVQALVLFDFGELEAAARAAKASAVLYGELLDRHSEAKALLQEAWITRLFNPRAALPVADDGLELLTEPEPKPLLSGLFSKCDCLIKLGRVAEAECLLSSSREQIRNLADAGDELWFGYIDALLLKAKGRGKDADTVLRHLALRFREEGLYQAMLFQHLERIRIKAELGQWRAAVNIAARLTPELARLGLRNDLLGMWASLQDALFQRRDVVNEIEDLFRRRWNSPSRVVRPVSTQIGRTS
jgi:hypothetical protein